MTPQQEAAAFVERLNAAIIFPLITLLSAIAFLFFLVGCAQYIMNAANEQAREQGKTHIMYGLIGLFVMVSAWAILTTAANTFGLGDQLDCANTPSGTGCNEVFRLPDAGGTNPGSGPNPGGTSPGGGSNPG